MTIQDIANEVAAAGGWKTYEVRQLRDAVGAQRAKANVVAKISKALESAGCGHVPSQIPKDQSAWVAVYSGQGAKMLVQSIADDSASLLASISHLFFDDAIMRAAVQVVDDHFQVSRNS